MLVSITLGKNYLNPMKLIIFLSILCNYLCATETQSLNYHSSLKEIITEIENVEHLIFIESKEYSSLLSSYESLYIYPPVDKHEKTTSLEELPNLLSNLEGKKVLVTTPNNLHLTKYCNKDLVVFIESPTDKYNDLQPYTQDYRLLLFETGVLIDSKDNSLSVSPTVHALSLSFFGNSQNEIENILKTEKQLAKEKESQSLIFGLTQESLLCKGLLLMERGEYCEASRTFHLLKTQGFNHWRLDWYISQAEYERRNLKKAQKALDSVIKQAPYFQAAETLSQKIADEMF